MYLKLKAKEQKAILEYLRTLPTHLEVTVNGLKFYLVHGFPAENVHDEVWFRPEEKKIAYAMDLEDRGENLKIYHGPGFIDIDCGCGYEMPIKKLACIIAFLDAQGKLLFFSTTHEDDFYISKDLV